jgi:tripartite-type tricarboxylate transporter receptor subunit TctC
MKRLFVFASLLLSTAASAQNFPSKPLRIVVPYGSGGAPDVLARMLAHKMTDSP